VNALVLLVLSRQVETCSLTTSKPLDRHSRLMLALEKNRR
jgi:hypothetical protein